MSQPTAQSLDTDSPEDPEAFFRRTMAGATDILWEQGLYHEGLAALHDVIDQSAQRVAAGTPDDDIHQ